jgi:hypothetical protein
MTESIHDVLRRNGIDLTDPVAVAVAKVQHQMAEAADRQARLEAGEDMTPKDARGIADEIHARNPFQ